jgi:hypothetical protein
VRIHCRRDPAARRGLRENSLRCVRDSRLRFSLQGDRGPTVMRKRRRDRERRAAPVGVGGYDVRGMEGRRLCRLGRRGGC